jgi:hypothetical protein
MLRAAFKTLSAKVTRQTEDLPKDKAEMEVVLYMQLMSNREALTPCNLDTKYVNIEPH